MKAAKPRKAITPTAWVAWKQGHLGVWGIAHLSLDGLMTRCGVEMPSTYAPAPKAAYHCAVCDAAAKEEKEWVETVHVHEQQIDKDHLAAHAKPTPGPWRVTGQDRVYSGEVIQSDNGWIAVCCDFNRYDRDAEREANARLIAAAPDLLESTRQLAALLDQLAERMHCRDIHLHNDYDTCTQTTCASVRTALGAHRAIVARLKPA